MTEAWRLKEPEKENGRLKKLLAVQGLKNDVIKGPAKKVVTANNPAWAGAAHDGLWPERAALADRHAHECQRPALCISPDCNADLRERILALAHRHKRYGVGMICLKLRQEGLLVNYKRVERLY